MNDSYTNNNGLPSFGPSRIRPLEGIPAQSLTAIQYQFCHWFTCYSLDGIELSRADFRCEAVMHQQRSNTQYFCFEPATDYVEETKEWFCRKHFQSRNPRVLAAKQLKAVTSKKALERNIDRKVYETCRAASEVQQDRKQLSKFRLSRDNINSMIQTLENGYQDSVLIEDLSDEDEEYLDRSPKPHSKRSQHLNYKPESSQRAQYAVTYNPDDNMEF